MLDAKEQVEERRMNDDCGETIEIVEREGSFLLIRAALRFAVVAQRASRASPMKPGERDGKPLTPEGLAAPVAEEGWLSEDEAQRQFREVCERSAIASVTQFRTFEETTSTHQHGGVAPLARWYANLGEYWRVMGGSKNARHQ